MVISTIIEVGLDELEEVIAASAPRRENDNQATVQVNGTPASKAGAVRSPYSTVIGTSAFKVGACVYVSVHVACFPEGIV